jgi:hypothetical protein
LPTSVTTTDFLIFLSFIPTARVGGFLFAAQGAAADFSFPARRFPAQEFFSPERAGLGTRNLHHRWLPAQQFRAHYSTARAVFFTIFPLGDSSAATVFPFPRSVLQLHQYIELSM